MQDDYFLFLHYHFLYEKYQDIKGRQHWTHTGVCVCIFLVHTSSINFLLPVKLRVHMCEVGKLQQAQGCGVKQ